MRNLEHFSNIISDNIRKEYFEHVSVEMMPLRDWKTDDLHFLLEEIDNELCDRHDIATHQMTSDMAQQEEYVAMMELELEAIAVAEMVSKSDA